MTETGTKRLIIDLQKCDQCESCSVSCGYHGSTQPEENGLSRLRERATFAVICRRCASASCIDACAFDALERNRQGIIQRHNMRCVSCKMCAHACPFGTIYTEMLTFYEVNCDRCLALEDDQPPCVVSCPHGALEFRVTDQSETDIHVIDLHLAARGEAWVRQETAP
jgi:Fe-S-cluster-containing hydrogenase component 2